MSKVSIIGQMKSDTYVSDCSITYMTPGASTTELAIAHDDIDGEFDGVGKLMLSGNKINASSGHTGSKYGFKANKVGSTNTVVVSGGQQLLNQKPSAGTLLVTSQELGAGSTGAGSAALGANCPAVTPTAPVTWKKVALDDGTSGYVPVWK